MAIAPCLFCSTMTMEHNTLDKYQKKREVGDQDNINAEIKWEPATVVMSNLLKCTKCSSCLHIIMEKIFLHSMIVGQ